MKKALQALAALASLPILLWDYFSPSTGKEYGVGFFRKSWLVYRMARNKGRIPTASHWFEHLAMAAQILRVPRNVEGSVIECGTFKGGSAANLSLVCALVGRRLDIFDSFEGIPDPSDSDHYHQILVSGETHAYEKGAYTGTIEEVKANITRGGRIEACDFHKGYFSDSLPGYSKSCVLAFLDVDLLASLKDCLSNIWPLLQDGCCLFTHEAHHMNIASLFFNDSWWRSTLNASAPGLVGAGSGLGLIPLPGGFRSALGYTMKLPHAGSFQLIEQNENAAVGA